MRKLAAAASTIVSMLAIFAPGLIFPASACENGVAIEVDPRVGAVSAAIAALGREQPLEAARIVARTYPHLRTASIHVDGLRTRAMRVMAMALVRLEGDAPVGADWIASTTEQRDANLRWSLRVLRGVAIASPRDPSVLTDLGEALSMRAATRAEAARVLEPLAEKDLVVGAHGWATVARVRLNAGDLAGHGAAAQRCAQMARVRGVCHVNGERPSEASVAGS